MKQSSRSAIGKPSSTPRKYQGFGLTPYNRDSRGFVPEGEKPYYDSMIFHNELHGKRFDFAPTAINHDIIIEDKYNIQITIDIYLFSSGINGINRFQVSKMRYGEFLRNYKNNRHELYAYIDSGVPECIYIFRKPLNANELAELNELKKIIKKDLLLFFPETDKILSGGAAKSKKYVLYNNKRRLVKINAENKKYIVCDRTDILLSTIKGKFRYILD
jgi:hypothetical protein